MRLTAVMVPALKYCFDTMINLKQNNLNLGETIYLELDRAPVRKTFGAITHTL